MLIRNYKNKKSAVVGMSLAAAMAVLGTSSLVNAAAFTAGNLVVSRVGDGSSSLVNSGGQISILEFTTTGSAAQAAIAIASTGANGLQWSGTATSEGALALSADGTKLTFAGYNPGAGGFTGTGSLAGRTSVQAPRAYGTINASGVYSFGATYTGSGTDFTGNNIRSAVSTASNTWSVGGVGGVVLNPSTAISTTTTNNRVVNIINGDLYYSTGAGSSRGIFKFTGTPTSAAVPSLLIDTGASSSSYDFAINTAGTVAYIAADAAGVQKWTLSGSTWTNVYSFTGATGVTGLAVDWSTNTIYATNPGNLLKAVDTGSAGTLSSIATAGTNYAFRGLEFAPQAAGGSPDIDLTPATITGNLLLNASVSGANTTVTLTNNGTAAGTPTLSATGSATFTPYSPAGSIAASGGVATTTVSISSTAAYGTVSGTVKATTASDPDALDQTSISINVGEAKVGVTTGDFGTALTAPVAASGSYAGLTSRTTTGEANALALGNEATIVAGTNDGDADNVSMKWRTRQGAEIYTAPNLPAVLSDIVNVENVDGAYVLTIAYKQGDVPPSWAETSLVLGWLNAGNWVNAVVNNTDNVYSGPALIGDWSTFVNAGDGLANDMGEFGVSTGNFTSGDVNYGGYVWAVLNHNSEFAVIPEPASLGILALGGLALMGRRRKA